VVVHGTVQGVGFRFACARLAERSGLGGWVSNRPEGTVEAVFEGEPEAVELITRWCHEGPLLARVTKVETFDEPVTGDHAFYVR
jgi:acylphosphatase